MSNNPLSRYLTEREFELAAEYESLGDDPERRDATGHPKATGGKCNVAEGASARDAYPSGHNAQRKRQVALDPRTRDRARHFLHRSEEEVLCRPQEASELFCAMTGTV